MLGQLLSNHFWLPSYVTLALGLWLPGDYEWLRPTIPIFLGGILYFSCLKIRLRDLPAQLRGSAAIGRVSAMTVAKLCILPLVAFALMRSIAPEWALGMLLLGMMPGGLSSLAMTDLYGGNLGLALILILFTSLLSPITIPLQLQFYDPVGPGIDWSAAARQAVYVIALLATPFALAQLTRKVAPRTVERYWNRWGQCSIASAILMIFASTAANRHGWQHFAAADLVAPFALACLNCAVYIGFAMAAHRFASDSDAMAFGCNCIYMNNGLAVAFADRFFHGNAHMILPAILMQVPMVAAVLAYGRWARRRVGMHETP